MPEHSLLAELETIQIDRNLNQSLRLQLVLQFRDLVQQQRLKAGRRLPSSRQMADEIGVSRKTVVDAYDQLIAEGYFHARQGAGTFVSEFDVPKPATNDNHADHSWIPDPETILPLSPGRMDPDLFPRSQWVRYASRGQRHLPPETLFEPPNGGYLKLRSAIADYIWAMRGIKCAPEQVIITSGLPESLRLICRAVLGTGKQVITEDPGYRAIDEVLLQNGIKPRYAPVDQEGLDYESVLANSDSIDAIIVASTRQYPLGYQLSAQRRLGLMNWNYYCDGLVIEDDYDCEFRFDGPRRQAIFAMDQSLGTYYFGSLSKTIFPRLRISFMIVPRTSVNAVTAQQNHDGSNASIIAQSALAEFVLSGEYTKHLRHMRRVYMARYQSLFKAFDEQVGHIMTPIPVNGGFHFTALFQHKRGEKISDTEIAARCHEAGIGVLSLSEFSSKTENRLSGLVIGFAGNDEASNQAGLDTLAQILHSSFG